MEIINNKDEFFKEFNRRWKSAQFSKEEREQLLEKLSTDLLKDKDVILEIIKVFPKEIIKVLNKQNSDFLNDESIVSFLVKKDKMIPLLMYGEKIRDNDKLVKIKILDGELFALVDMSERLKNDRQFLLSIFDELKGTKEDFITAFNYLPKDLIKDKNFILDLFKCAPKIYDCLPNEMKLEKKNVLKYIKAVPLDIGNLPLEIRRDVDVLTIYIKENGNVHLDVLCKKIFTTQELSLLVEKLDFKPYGVLLKALNYNIEYRNTFNQMYEKEDFESGFENALMGNPLILKELYFLLNAKDLRNSMENTVGEKSTKGKNLKF